MRLSPARTADSSSRSRGRSQSAMASSVSRLQASPERGCRGRCRGRADGRPAQPPRSRGSRRCSGVSPGTRRLPRASRRRHEGCRQPRHAGGRPPPPDARKRLQHASTRGCARPGRRPCRLDERPSDAASWSAASPVRAVVPIAISCKPIRTCTTRSSTLQPWHREGASSRSSPSELTTVVNSRTCCPRAATAAACGKVTSLMVKDLRQSAPRRDVRYRPRMVEQVPGSAAPPRPSRCVCSTTPTGSGVSVVRFPERCGSSGCGSTRCVRCPAVQGTCGLTDARW